MSERTGIEWTDATWNPIRARRLVRPDAETLTADGERLGWHCEHVSEGCRNCYAEAINRRLGTRLDFKRALRPHIYLDGLSLAAPARWRRARKIFIGSMTDVFADFVPDGFIDRIFEVVAISPRHTFQMLTKRPARMLEYVSRRSLDRIAHATGHGTLSINMYDKRLVPLAKLGRRPAWPLPNLWLGVSVEDQDTVEARVPLLLNTPAARRFVSAEPLLGPVNLTRLGGNYLRRNALTGLLESSSGAVVSRAASPSLDWVIAGGESGPAARPMHPDWARDLRDQCAAAGVPFFFKQWGGWVPSPLGSHWLARTGRMRLAGTGPVREPSEAVMQRIGKKAAGAELDGREWREFPSMEAHG